MKEKENRGRTVNVKRNIVYGMLQIAVSVIFPFCVRTVLIYRFGLDYLGLNSLFTLLLMEGLRNHNFIPLRVQYPAACGESA